MNLNPRYMINRLRAERVLIDMPCDYPGFNSEHDKELISKVKSDIIYELKHIDNQDVFDTIKYVENEAFRSGYAHREAEIRIANGEDPVCAENGGIMLKSWNSKSNQWWYERAIEEAFEHGLTADELKLSYQNLSNPSLITKSERIYRMVLLAFFLGRLWQIRCMDEGLNMVYPQEMRD